MNLIEIDWTNYCFKTNTATGYDFYKSFSKYEIINILEKQKIINNYYFSLSDGHLSLHLLMQEIQQIEYAIENDIYIDKIINIKNIKDIK